ncbi:MAG TPA: bifunctional DNA primase/polymerase [Thermaerobacter sp.]
MDSVAQTLQPDTPNSPSLLETALFLHRQGLALLPIRPGTKEPHTDVLRAVYGSTEWGPLAQRRASLPEVLAWFQHDPNCQLAVIAGPASGNIAILDVDKLDDAGEMLDRLEALGGPVAETPRPGRHFWIRQRYPIPNGDLCLPGGRKVGEIKSGYNHEGKPAAAYVLVPPSLHPDGDAYRWKPRRGLDAPLPELSAADLDALIRGDAAPAADADIPPSRAEVSKYEYSYLLTPADRPEELVKQLQRHPAFIEGALRLLGLERVRIGQAFKCILPGHDERRPSAALYRLDDGSVLYHDFHGREGHDWLTLAECYAALLTGRVRKLSKPEHTAWILRLAVDAGVLEPAKVEAPEPPADLRPAARKVYEGFLRLLSIKWLHTPNAATVFSWRFAAGWCGVSERHAGEAMRELLRRGLIRKVGEHKPARGRPQALFLPGLAARRGGAKDADKPARPWARKAVKDTIRAARARKDSPAEPCAKCGGTRFWRLYARKKGEYPQWICESCLPPPHDAVEWCEVQPAGRFLE